MAVKKIALLNPPHQFTVIDVTDPATLYSLDMEGTGFSLPHALTAAEARALTSGTNFSGADAGRMWLANSPMAGGGTAMRIDYEPNYTGPWCQGQIDVADKTEMYMAFDVYFPNNYIFPKMQKMIALIGGGHIGNTNPNLLGTQVYCGFNVAGRNSSVSRPVANVDGEIRVYRYTATRAQENIGTNAAFQKGVKNTVELRVKNNTSASCTSCDGITQAWLNGINILNLTTTKWISTVDASLQWEKLFMHFYVGGQGAEFEHAQNQSVYFDNFLVSENPITH